MCLSELSYQLYIGRVSAICGFQLFGSEVLTVAWRDGPERFYRRKRVLASPP
jgi:hypothetical protein